MGIAALLVLGSVDGSAQPKSRALIGEERGPAVAGVASRSGGASRRTEKRGRKVTIDNSAVVGTDTPNGAEAVGLSLFPDVNLTATKSHFERQEGARFAWSGKVSDDPLSMVVLVGGEGPTYGSVFAHGKHYAIRGADAASQEVVEIDQSAFPPEAYDQYPAGVQIQAAPTAQPTQDALADTGSIIDVLVVYTPAAESAESAKPGSITSLINLAVAETNASYANSGISPRLKLVHAQRVEYTESGNWYTDRDRLVATDGYMDNVHSLRSTYGADVVVLLINDDMYCGLAADIMAKASTAFALVQYDCATGYYSFGHEIGHLQGARHDLYVDRTDGWTNPPALNVAYNHGDVNYATADLDSEGKGHRTIMAYNDDCLAHGVDCKRRPYWSRPGALYPGTSTQMGSSADENNALVLNSTAYMVANFKPAVVPTVRLTVQSTYPASGVLVTASPPDRGGTNNGTTALSLTYNTNASVTLTAPATAPGAVPGTGDDPFSSWTGCTSTNPIARTCTVSMTGNKTVVANYTPDNYLPTLNAVSNLTINEDALPQTVNLSGISAGPAGESGQTLLWSANSSNPDLIPDPPQVNHVNGDATGSLTFTPKLDANGTATITVTVADDGGGPYNTISRSFVVTVNAVNDPPKFSKALDPLVADPTVFEDAGAQTVSGWATDMSAGAENESLQTLSFTTTSDSPALFAVQPAVAANGTLTFRPALNANGSALVTVRLRDNGGTANGGVNTSDPRQFTITVRAVNDPPTLSAISNRTVGEDAAVQKISLSGISAGPANESAQPLSVTATSSKPELIPDDPQMVSYPGAGATASLSFLPVRNASGTATITVTVKDGQSENDTFSRSFDVKVNAVNDRPTLDAILNATFPEGAVAREIALGGISAGVGETQPVTVAAVSSNKALIPNPTVTYTPGDSTGKLTLTPVAGAAGKSTITVTVKDGQPANNTFAQKFVVTVNDPPTLNAITEILDGKVTIDEDAGRQTFALTGITAGGRSQTLKVTAVSTNPGVIPNPKVSYVSPQQTGSLSFMPVANASGTATITVTVNDGQSANNTCTQSFLVTVNPINDAPTLNAIPNRTIGEDAAVQTVLLSGISAGPANESAQALTVTATSSNPGLIPTPPQVKYTPGQTKGSLSFTPVADANSAMNGTATITVTVDDEGGALPDNTFSRSFVVTVNAVNDLPTLAPIANVAIAGNAGEQAVTLDGISAGPANESAQSLSVTAVSSNRALIPNPTVIHASPEAWGLRYTPAANAFGQAKITVTVKDGQAANNTTKQTFLVMVSQATLADAPAGTASAVVQTATTPLELQTALTTAATNGRNDVIRLAGGTYALSGNGDEPFGFFSTEDLDLLIEGGWTSDFSQRAANIPTELTGDLPTPVNTSGGVLGITTGGSVQLDGVSIGGGSTLGSGGGLYVSAAGSIVVGGCEVKNNTSEGEGGGLFLESSGGEVRLFGCTIAGNIGASGGGGVIRAVSASVSTNEISGNSAAVADGGLQVTVGSGGAMTVSNNTIYGNQAPAGSSGLSVAANGGRGISILNIHNNIVYGNGAATNFIVAPDSDCVLNYLDLNIVNNDIACYELCPEYLLDGSNLSVDFSGRGAGDIRLSGADTALIDAGIAGGASTEDFEGDALPLDGNGDSLAAPDIGADEYNPGYVTGPSSMTVTAGPGDMAAGEGAFVTVLLDRPAKRDMVLYLHSSDDVVVSIPSPHLRIVAGSNGAQALVQAGGGAGGGAATITATDPSGVVSQGMVVVTVPVGN